MSKVKTSMMIIATTIILVLIILGTYLGLVSSGELIVDKRPLEVTIAEKTKIYDGKPIEGDYFITEGALFGRDELKVNFDTKNVNAGTYALNPTISVIGSDGSDRTSNYIISIKSAQGIINPRKIQVGLKKDYFYGDKLTSKSFEIVQGELVDGDLLIPNYEIIETPKLDGKPVVDTPSALKIKCEVVDANGKDVKSNYDIASEIYLPVDKRQVIVKSKSASKVFDGAPLDNREFIAEGLLEGHTLIIESGTTAIINAGESVNSFDNAMIKIFDDKNKDVTESYNIFIQNLGKLTIEKAYVTARMKEKSAVYIGKDIEIDNENNYELDPADTDLINKVGYKFNISNLPKVKNVGVYTNNPLITLLDSNNQRQNNIVLNVVPSTFTVKPKEISKVDISDVEFDYTGKDYFEIDNSKITTKTGIEGDVILFSDNIIKIENSNASTNKKDIYVLPQQLKVLDKYGKDVTENYIITGDIKVGVLIKKRNVIINTVKLDPVEYDTISKYNEGLKRITGYDNKINFNGDEIVSLSYSINESKNVNNNVGNQNIEVDVEVNILNNFGININDNYNVEINPDNNGVTQSIYLPIEPKTITVNVPLVQREYNGKDQEIKPQKWDDLLNSSDKEYLNRVKANLIGTAYKAKNVKIYDDFKYGLNFGSNNNNNIKIIENYAGFEMLPKELKLTAFDNLNITFSKNTYDPNKDTNNSVTKAEGLCSGDKITYTYKKGNFKNVGTYDNEIVSYKIETITKEDVTENYKLVANNKGTLVINPAEVTATAKNVTIPFTGNKFDLNDDWYTLTMEEGYTAKLEYKGNLSVANIMNGTATVTMKSYTIYDENGIESQNYKIKFVKEASVKYNSGVKTQLKLRAQNYITTYDGKAIEFGKNAEIPYIIEGSNYVSNENIKISYSVTGEIKNAGRYDVSLRVNQIIYDGANITSLFDCNMAKALCIVEKALVYVSTNSLTMEYGEELLEEDRLYTCSETSVEVTWANAFTQTTPAGTYTNDATVTDDNYIAIFDLGTVTIKPKSVIITAQNYNIKQGASGIIIDTSWATPYLENPEDIVVLSSKEIQALETGCYIYIKSIKFSKNYDVTILGGNIIVTA